MPVICIAGNGGANIAMEKATDVQYHSAVGVKRGGISWAINRNVRAISVCGGTNAGRKFQSRVFRVLYNFFFFFENLTNF